MNKQSFPHEFLEEIKIVQGIINRMATNSFMIKGWTITLVVISLLIDGKDIHCAVAFLPWLVFWILDAYYLRQERCYRKLYEWLIVNRKDSLNQLFDMNAESRFGHEVDGILYIMISKTLLPIYGVILVLIIILSYYSISVMPNV